MEPNLKWILYGKDEVNLSVLETKDGPYWLKELKEAMECGKT